MIFCGVYGHSPYFIKILKKADVEFISSQNHFVCKYQWSLAKAEVININLSLINRSQKSLQGNAKTRVQQKFKSQFN